MVDCYEEERVYKEVWDIMKKLFLEVRRMGIDGFINYGFIGIYIFHFGIVVKLLVKGFY